MAYAYPGRSRILEAQSEVGGLCRSIEFGGGVFDIGGHSFHTPHPQVRELVERLMAGRWVSQRRDARVYFGGQIIDYPFQEHFDQIADPRIVAECRDGLAAASLAAGADTFEDWIVGRFGAGVARHFMLPYNRKLWARDLRRMSCDWVGERVAGAPESAAPRSAPARRPLHAQSEVGYPAHGGFAEIYKALAGRCGPIELCAPVCDIDPERRTALAADGRSWSWDRLVSTAPLPLLVRMVRGCPGEIIALADRLEYVSLKVLLILVARGFEAQPQRVYAADAAIPPHKTAFNHSSSPSLRRRPVQAVTCEISHSAEKPAPPEADLERATLDWLFDAGLVADRGDFAQTRWIDVRYAYPVYTDDRAAIVRQIRDHLAGLGVFSVGRFGAWQYVNSDACIDEGLRLGAALAGEGLGAGAYRKGDPVGAL